MLGAPLERAIGNFDVIAMNRAVTCLPDQALKLPLPFLY